MCIPHALSSVHVDIVLPLLNSSVCSGWAGLNMDPHGARRLRCATKEQMDMGKPPDQAARLEEEEKLMKQANKLGMYNAETDKTSTTWCRLSGST